MSFSKSTDDCRISQIKCVSHSYTNNPLNNCNKEINLSFIQCWSLGRAGFFASPGLERLLFASHGRIESAIPGILVQHRISHPSSCHTKGWSKLARLSRRCTSHAETAESHLRRGCPSHFSGSLALPCASCAISNAPSGLGKRYSSRILTQQRLTPFA